MFPAIVMGITITLYGCKKEKFQTNPVNGTSDAIFNSNKTYGTLTDQDGNIYKTITIGNQTWMAENLRTTIFRNGEPIPEVTDKTGWENTSTAAYCNPNNIFNADSITTYGRLYNWFAAYSTTNIAPKGWHVPTLDEWITLITSLGGVDIAGGKLKETGLSHWSNPNECANNESGFTALPGVDRKLDLGFTNAYARLQSSWWTSTQDGSETPPYLDVEYNNCKVFNTSGTNNHTGLYIRLVKD